MKNIMSQSSRAPVEVLCTGPDPVVPDLLDPVVGALLWRVNHRTVMLWDGEEFIPLDIEGWYGKYATQFPMPVPVGYWAVVGPLMPAAPGGHPSQAVIDRDTLMWAFRQISNEGSDKSDAVSDQGGCETTEPTLTLTE